jgi:ABC-type phosphate/phosphonate transport system substrate-binding protein
MSDGKASNSGGVMIRLLLILVVLPALAYGGYHAYTVYGVEKAQPVDVAKILSGYEKQFANKATFDSTNYTDANGDLIADPPPADKQVLPEVLTFCGIGVEDHAKQSVAWAPLLQHLQEQLDKAGIKTKVEYFNKGKIKVGDEEKVDYIRSIDEQIRLLKEGKLHVTVLNTGGVVWAANTAGFVPLCVPADPQGNYAIKMVILANKNSGISSLTALGQTPLHLTSMSSNSGFKMPIVLMKQKYNKLPGKDYEFLLTGGHVPSIRGVARGDFKVVATVSDLLAREESRKDKDGKPLVDKSAYTIIDESPEVPPLCLGYAYNLKSDLVEVLKKTLIGDGPERFRFEGNSVGELYKASNQTQFVPINYKEAFKFVREVDQVMLKLADSQ